MQERSYSTIVNYVEKLMTQQIERDHFACGEHSNFHIPAPYKNSLLFISVNEYRKITT